MFKNQPKGLYVLALSNTGERFGYYTMIAILLLFLQAKFGFSTGVAGTIYSAFLALVYFMPMLGGWVADKWNFQKTVTLGIVVMFIGYLVLAIPTPRLATSSLVIFLAGLLCVCTGTGLFKGNLQVMVGDLYNDPKYSAKRDLGFSLFYMAINIGAMFAPSMSVALCQYALGEAGFVYNPALPSICTRIIGDGIQNIDPEALQTVNNYLASLPEATAAAYFGNLPLFAEDFMNAISSGYSLAFAVACASMVVSFIIYKLGKSTYACLNETKAVGNSSSAAVPELTKEQTRSRIVALLLVFTVVIFFWMVFNQNGMCLTKFAEVFTETETSSWTRVGFNVWALALIVVVVYALFSVVQSASGKAKTLSAIIAAIALGALVYIYKEATPDPVTGLQPQIYQQFNPFYVVALTPFSVALFAWLARIGKEPSAPRKIGIGMLVAAFAFAFMVVGSLGLGVPPVEGQGNELVSPNLLITTYLFLTFAELLLSPMGISFVSKVAPPKYKGLMMGCWFGATAIGNYLVSIPALLWNHIDVAVLWGILIAVCLLSALFIFSIMKKLETATA